MKAMQQSDYAPKHDPSDPISPVNPSFTFDSKDDTRHEDHTHENISATDQVAPSMVSSTNSESPSLPRLSRAFSMPLPSQTSHWQHPGRISFVADSSHTLDGEQNTDQHFHDLALELADSVQLAVQTLFQLSPPHIFDPAKEQFSGCTVQVPTPSLTALLMSMKNLNYISANIQALGSPRGGSPTPRVDIRPDSIGKDEFDIAEVLQNVGDSFGGIASEAEVDLVLHHGDALKHIGVRGDECGISYALSHILHQVLATARRGDSIEIGLSIVGQPSNSNEASGSFENESPPLDSTGPVVCTFDVAHKFTSFVPSLTIDTAPDEDMTEYMLNNDLEAVPLWRPEPQFDSMILRRLLAHIGGILRPSLEPRSFPKGRRCELSISLERGPSILVLHQRTAAGDEDIYRDFSVDFSLAKEPSIDELMRFTDSLKGKKVIFHASSRGSFAHHLTRYLTAWGMDISHVPTDSIEEKDSSVAEVTPTGDVPMGAPGSENIPPIIDNVSESASDKVPLADINPTFIVIDDDILTLRRRLLQYQAEMIPNISLHSRKRPSLAAHHRPRSTPSIRNALLASGMAYSSSTLPFTPVPIVHFTSLGKYKLVKDVIQANILSLGIPQFLPEVIVIPKPAGPRRILTSLHTAICKPIVDPFFSPIATSPMSTSGHQTSFRSGRKAPNVLSQSTVRVVPDRPSRTNSDSTTHPSTSPLSIPEGLEYFSETATKRLGSNAASGFVIQSPDGRPAGIFFQPQSRTSSSKSDVSGTVHSEARLRPPFHGRVGSYQAMKLEGHRDRTDDGDAGFRPGAQAKPSPTILEETVLSSPQSTAPTESPEMRRIEGISNNKGKGRMGVSDIQHEEIFPPIIEWREATEMLAMPAVATVPSLVSTPSTSGSRSVVHSPSADQVQSPPPLTRKASSQTASSPHSPTSPTGLGAKRPSGRRATVGTKSPLGSAYGKKTTKTVSSNIVPPINVLLVEDNPINQTMVSIFMKKNKIKYEVAWNGKEAVEKWKKGHFHIILMDIQMPVMDGIAATKEIRRLEKLENIRHFPPSPGDGARRSTGTPDSQSLFSASTPSRSQVIIVALTASARQSDRVAALAAGCNDFLTKPVMNSWLADKIIEWGSIKALQMWAELRPAIEDTFSNEQTAQAHAVAEKLHVPPMSARRSPSRCPDTPFEDGKADLDMMQRDLHKLDREGEGAPSSKSREDSNSPADSNPDDEGRYVSIDEPPTIISYSANPSDISSKAASEFPSIPLCDNAKQVSEDGSSLSVDPLGISVQPASPTEEPVVVDDSNVMMERTSNCSRPIEVTGEKALLQYLEETKEQDTYTGRPTLLGQRGIDAVGSSQSIASVLHDAAAVKKDEPNSEKMPPTDEH